MNQKERGFIAILLMGIIVMVATDLATDAREGARWWHLGVEGSVAVAALLGLYVLMRDTFALKHSLAQEKHDSMRLRAEAQRWRDQSKKYIEGLSEAIDVQLNQWGLTFAEKEVALLLLKGLSLKEIAGVRNTAEKTARAQSLVVYAKSGLSGRSELAAYFLEDLFLPQRASEKNAS